ncbi:hypothetical protein ACSFA0_23620 [Variovorax sp. LT1P1]|uniref:hypothetical protein n=1 Tax=Variovorax sp. LT1P1 TaxID=3443730 RepID=UPI003F48ADB8
MTTAKALPLIELVPSQCEAGGRFYGIDCLRVPVHLAPQHILHWVADSAIASLNEGFARNLVDGLIEHGAGLDLMTRMRSLHGPAFSSQKVCVLSRFSNSDAASLTREDWTLKASRATALGAAVLAMNRPAVRVMLSVLTSMGASTDPAAPAASFSTAEGITEVNTLIDLAARIRSPVILRSLIEAFGMGPGTPEHADCLGVALGYVLQDHLPETSLPLNSERSELRAVVLTLLSAGAAPPAEVWKAGAVDASWLLKVATFADATNCSSAIRRLALAGWPLDAVGADGLSAMHFACIESNGDALACLLEAGADTRIKDRRGRTVAQVAEDGFPTMHALLRSWELRRAALRTLSAWDTPRGATP